MIQHEVWYLNSCCPEGELKAIAPDPPYFSFCTNFILHTYKGSFLEVDIYPKVQEQSNSFWGNKKHRWKLHTWLNDFRDSGVQTLTNKCTWAQWWSCHEADKRWRLALWENSAGHLPPWSPMLLLSKQILTTLKVVKGKPHCSQKKLLPADRKGRRQLHCSQDLPPAEKVTVMKTATRLRITWSVRSKVKRLNQKNQLTRSELKLHWLLSPQKKWDQFLGRVGHCPEREVW